MSHTCVFLMQVVDRISMKPDIHDRIDTEKAPYIFRDSEICMDVCAYARAVHTHVILLAMAQNSRV